MKHKLFCTLGFILLAMMSFFAGPAKAQTVASGPYYANPSWDQTLACTTLANCPRFIVLSNMNSAAVLDRETGLVWERSPSTDRFSWNGFDGAKGHCNTLRLGHRRGWRLPTVQELASLVDDDSPDTSSTSLPPGHPFTGVGGFYWSAISAVELNHAWYVLFSGHGDVGLEHSDTAQLGAWCVRGGQGVDPQ
jgi:hypothetical protein